MLQPVHAVYLSARMWTVPGACELSRLLEQRLASIAGHGGSALVVGGRRGIEKESLRITPEGFMARTPHPHALGSALTNKYVTTDYSEAQLEFVTPPERSAWAAMQFLCDIHQFVYEKLHDELLWPLSMPCRLQSQDDIPLAQYGSSNIGRMKTIYRNGLGRRYGRYMQVISGIHFNYSVPDGFWPALATSEGADIDLAGFKSERYMGLVRNVRRLDWLLLYLFGASPAVCGSFLAGADTDLDRLDDGTYFGRWATSLRMSGLGYQNSNQATLQVSANSLDEYVRDLSTAIATSNDDYARLGLRKDDEYLQLNSNQLQIENEYYSAIRPKRVARSGERPTSALRRGGVEYVELRALDISPFDPSGIGQSQQKFLEAFLIYCLLLESPPVSASEHHDIRRNHSDIARRGRQPELMLVRDGQQLSVREWAAQICGEMRPIFEMLDEAGDGTYVQALEQQLEAVRHPELTPSARLLADLHETGASFADYGLQLARDYRDYFCDLAPEFNAQRALFETESASSHGRQADIEAADTLSLDDYLTRYYA